MGKLAEAIIAYKQSPINSPKEREAKEIIEQITGGQWWKDNVGTEFKWPKKWQPKRAFGFYTDWGFSELGPFIVPTNEMEQYKDLLTNRNRKQ